VMLGLLVALVVSFGLGKLAIVGVIAVGALLLATSVILAVQAYRHTSPQTEAVMAHPAPTRVVA